MASYTCSSESSNLGNDHGNNQQWLQPGLGCYLLSGNDQSIHLIVFTAVVLIIKKLQVFDSVFENTRDDSEGEMCVLLCSIPPKH